MMGEGIVTKPGRSGAFTGDNKVDALRSIAFRCESKEAEFTELSLQEFKDMILRIAKAGLS